MSSRLSSSNPDTIDAVLRFDEERGGLLQKIEELQKKRNELTQQVKSSRDQYNTNDLIEQVREIKKKLDDIEPRLRMVDNNLRDLAVRIPNPPLPDVKVGK